MRSVSERRWMSCSKSSTTPSLLSSNPAMTEISVVLPQPLGPTRNVSCPWNASKSTPRSTCTVVAPSPKSLRTARQLTAGNILVFMESTSKNNRRFKDQHAAQAQNTGQDHNQNHASASQRDTLPHQNNSARRQLVLTEVVKKFAGHPSPDGKADDPHGKRLQE